MSEQFFKGPISVQRRKADLQAIAEALELDSTGTVKLLVARIKAYVKEHNEELSMKSRFQGLTTDAGYRPGVGGTTKGTGKTSAEKAAQDKVEDGKPTAPPTGANKKLLESKVTTDPPASFEPLSTRVTPADTNMSEISALTPSDHNDQSSSPAPPRTPEHTSLEDQSAHDKDTSAEPRVEDEKINSGWETPARGQKVMRSIIVRVRDLLNRDAEPEDIYLREGEDGIVVEDRDIAGDGSVVPCGRLDQILPAAISQNTPMKVKGGRMYRPGQIASGGSRVALGSIKSILSGEAKQLRIDKVRIMPLIATDRETLLCDILLEHESQNTSLISGRKVEAKYHRHDSVVPVDRHEATSIDRHEATPIIHHEATPLPTKAAGTSATSTQVNKNYAPEKKSISTSEKESTLDISKPGQAETFKNFLRKTLDPPAVSSARATTARVVLNRHKVVLSALAKLASLGWERTAGGFQVPDDVDGPHAGKTFVREAVYEALGFRHSQVNSDRSLFKKMEDIPKVSAWFDEPDGKHGKKFNTMSIPNFKAYRAQALESKLKKVDKVDMRSKGNGKKRTQHPSSDDSGEEAESSKKAKKDHRKSTPESDHLDSESD